MDLFRKKKKENQEKAEPAKKSLVKKTSPEGKKKTGGKDVKQKITYPGIFLLRPRITEKAAVQADESNSYTFEVADNATKKDIGRAFETVYKIKPLKISIVKLHRRKVLIRGREGFKKGVKKAMVFLKKGDKIEFV